MARLSVQGAGSLNLSPSSTLGEKAKAILVFPSILKAGLISGGQRGNGALIIGGKSVAYYNIAAVSYGLQAGAQEFGYAMFLMTDAARKYLDSSEGWEVCRLMLRTGLGH